MITVFNAQNYAQQWFFDKAFALLKGKNLLNADEIKYGRFLSLDGYFAHMQDLVLTDPVYTMIPSDEEPFVIDANARTISIPAAFNKCAGVVGDNMCEIVTFTIDRYFDYVDLATAEICVQWSTADGEGISHIGLRDLETVPGKIRFGWPLTGELTKKAGNITFAVRFFIKDQDKFVYLLNTLSTSITIRPTLILTNPNVDPHDATSEFGKFIQNSENPTYPKPAPVYFNDKPGLNLLPQDKIDDADQLTMKAQATVSDNGHIVYNWYFKRGAKPGAEAVVYKKQEGVPYDPNAKYYEYDIATGTYVEAWPNDSNFEEGTYFLKEELVGELIVSDPDGDYFIKETYEEIVPTPTKRVGGEQYFKKISGEDEEPAYELVIDEELPKQTKLYERYTTLEIVPGGSEDVAGLYWVGASNYVGETSVEVKDAQGNVVNVIDGRNHTPEIISTRCYVPTPDPVNITTDLVEDLFMTEQEDKTLKATMKIATTEDTGSPKRTYSWYYNDENSTINKNGEVFLDELVAQEVDKNSLDVTDTAKVGWYYAHIDSLLNRKHELATTKVCRVLAPIKAPTLLKMEYKKWDDTAKQFSTAEEADAYFNDMTLELTYQKSTDPEVEDYVHQMSDKVAGRGDIIRLSITTDLDNAARNKTGLEADEIKYDWYVWEPDKLEPRPLVKADIDEAGNGFIPAEGQYTKLGKPYIDIRCLENDYKCKFFCKVTNYLANAEKALESADYTVMFEIH